MKGTRPLDTDEIRRGSERIAQPTHQERVPEQEAGHQSAL